MTWSLRSSQCWPVLNTALIVNYANRTIDPLIPEKKIYFLCHWEDTKWQTLIGHFRFCHSWHEIIFVFKYLNYLGKTHKKSVFVGGWKTKNPSTSKKKAPSSQTFFFNRISKNEQFQERRRKKIVKNVLLVDQKRRKS